MFPGPRAGRDKLLDYVQNYEIFDEIFIAPLQNVLNVTFVTDVVDISLSLSSQFGIAYNGWFLQVRTGEAFFTKFPNRIAFDRGAAYPTINSDSWMDKMGICDNFFDPDSTEFNFSFLSIVDGYVWGSFAFTVLCYAFIWKSFKQVFLFCMAIGSSVTLP